MYMQSPNPTTGNSHSLPGECVLCGYVNKRSTEVFKVDWQFNTNDPKIKLKCLYLNLQLQQTVNLRFVGGNIWQWYTRPSL